MDDFFDEIPDKKEEEISVNADMPTPKEKKKGKRSKTFLTVLLAVVCFLAGGFSVWFSLDKEVRTLMKIKAAIGANYYKDIDDESFYGAVFGGVNSILDDYSYYMTADEYKASVSDMAGNRSGLGLVFSTINAQGEPQMKITRVCGNSPAEAAGITAGSFLTGFGLSENALTESEEFDKFYAFLEDLEEGEAFFVRIITNGNSKIVSLAKAVYVENYVFYRTNTKAYGFTGKEATDLEERGLPLACLKDDTAYIRLVSFGGSASEEFDKAMTLFKQEGKKHLVLDLRENGGGYLDVMREISKYFCKIATEKRPVVAIADYNKKQTKFKATGNVYGEYFSADSRICVLADNGTASASECLIGCMVDYGATGYADICLSYRNGVAKTFGKGIMQTTYYISARGEALKLTTAEILWPSGKSIHGRGVLPEDGAKTANEGATDDMEITEAIEKLFG